MLSPIIFQIVYTRRALNGKGHLSIFITFLWTLVLVILSTICTSLIYIGMIEFADNSEELTDMSGILVFVSVGVITAFIIAPVTGLIGLLDQHSQKRDSNQLKKRDEKF